MITFFTTLKRHQGHIAVIQRNALMSWINVCPDCHIVLLGDDDGTREMAHELGAEHVPDVPRNAYGTPRLDGLFEAAEQRSPHRLMCYINADIVLMSDFAAALRATVRRKRRCLLVGRRWDCDVTEPIHFDAQWEDRLRETVRQRGKLCPPTMIDYFIYPRGVWGNLPPFAVGRTVWDNWLIYRARWLRLPVIDATDRVMAVHQNHDYGHAVTAQTRSRREAGRPRGYKQVWCGPEARDNFAMAGGKHNLYTIWDTTHRLTGRGLELRGQVGLGGGIWSYRRSARGGI